MEEGNENKRKDVEDQQEDENDVGPQPKKKKGINLAKIHRFSIPSAALKFENLYMNQLPSAELYEKSYMHRDVVTHLTWTKTDFLISASADGHVKFWKKQPKGIEFVKHFRAHMGKNFPRIFLIPRSRCRTLCKR
jgi:peptidylprolyl isomerase domain and WD repeat-containing protein 1